LQNRPIADASGLFAPSVELAITSGDRERSKPSRRPPSQSPSSQSSLSTRRVIFDPVDGLSGQAGLFGDLSDAHGLLAEHGAHLDELLASEARLTATVGAVAALLGVLDTGPLSRLGGLSVCLSGALP